MSSGTDEYAVGDMLVDNLMLFELRAAKDHLSPKLGADIEGA